MLLERTFAQDATVTDAIQRHAAGKAQIIADPVSRVDVPSHSQHNFFGDALN